MPLRAQVLDSLSAEDDVPRELSFPLNASGTRYIKASLSAQVWARFNQSNPGTLVFGQPRNSTFDIGIRRVRIRIMSQLTERVFIYAQLGQASLNRVSPRQVSPFFQDVVTEFTVLHRWLTLGGGLTSWGGFARLTSASISTFTTLDTPVFCQPTINALDQSMRKYSLYAKGKLKKLDYRLAISDPFPIQTANGQYDPVISPAAHFAPQPPHKQYSTYWSYQFLDEESNQTPYFRGSYLGAKRVFNLGLGTQWQHDAMWQLADNGRDTLRTAMWLWAADAYLDLPTHRGEALTAYAGYYHYDLGNYYLRSLGIMNPANGVNPAQQSLNGAGNAFPLIGTGSSVYLQAAYLLRPKLFSTLGTLQPYADLIRARYDALRDPMLSYNVGVNWLIRGFEARITLNYQNRPVFRLEERTVKQRRGAVVLQYQIII
ncbi:hypothetical protein [Catalinimonas alkaloidigena]|uniref:hypothetical protein n=1 Tax=Catalinimonas alkaloidigena TaxID=1075417 RepID=UPI000B7CA986|nr:hypothetical protein [Catalinimonas alkaloidigena]